MLLQLDDNLFIDLDSIQYFDGEVIKLDDGSYLEPKNKEKVQEALKHAARLNWNMLEGCVSK